MVQSQSRNDEENRNTNKRSFLPAIRVPPSVELSSLQAQRELLDIEAKLVDEIKTLPKNKTADLSILHTVLLREIKNLGNPSYLNSLPISHDTITMSTKSIKPVFSSKSRESVKDINLRNDSDASNSSSKSISTLSCFSEEILENPRFYLKNRSLAGGNELNMLQVLFEDHKFDPAAVYKKLQPSSPSISRDSSTITSPRLKRFNRSTGSSSASSPGSVISNSCRTVKDIKRSIPIGDRLEEERKSLIQKEINKQLNISTDYEKSENRKKLVKNVFKPLETKIEEDVNQRLDKIFEKLNVLKNTVVILPAEPIEEKTKQEEIILSSTVPSEPSKPKISKADKILGKLQVLDPIDSNLNQTSRSSFRGLFTGWGNSNKQISNVGILPSVKSSKFRSSAIRRSTQLMMPFFDNVEE